MKQTEIEALLGRSLTSREVTNIKLYLDIAKQSLQDLVCLDLSCQSIEEERTYTTREGYSTLFLDMVITEVEEIKLDGVVVEPTEYHLAFFDNRNGEVFNSIVFNTPFCKSEDIVINATWGFQKLPNDLQMLWAQLFANTSKRYATGSVKSKKVEDFTVTYGDLSDEQTFVNQNANVIRKYSLCNIGNVRHGRVYPDRNFYGYRI